MSRPQLWVIAGPNGAGKSTLAQKHLAGRLPIVNPDELAESIRPRHGGNLQVIAAASRQALQARNSLLKERTSLAIETTLTGHSELRFMSEARAQGYKVTLVYVGLDGELRSHMRVKHRVEGGGHEVPVEAIRRRYPRSLKNLPLAMKIAQRTLILDNTQKRSRLILSRDFQRLKFVSRKLPRWAQKAIPIAMRRSQGHEMGR